MAENVAAIEAVVAAGIQVVICTGRTLPGSRRFVEQLPQVEGEYLIVHHGGVTHRLPDLEVVSEFRLIAEEIEGIAAWFDSVEDLAMTAYDTDHLYYVGPEEISDLVK